MIVCSWIRILQCWGPPTRAGLGGDWLACLPLSCSPHIKFACEERRAEHGAGHGHCHGMFRHQPQPPAQPAPASFNMLSNVRRAVETQLFCLKWSCSPHLERPRGGGWKCTNITVIQTSYHGYYLRSQMWFIILFYYGGWNGMVSFWMFIMFL